MSAPKKRRIFSRSSMSGCETESWSPKIAPLKFHPRHEF
jgi:hypothetical protein